MRCAIRFTARMSRFEKGLGYAFVSAIIWAIFPVLTKLSFGTISALWSAAIGTFLSTIFFLGVVIARGELKQKVSALCKKRIFIACMLIGVLYYACLYVGISMTTPGNAAIVSLMEIFFSYLLISVIGKHEKLVPAHVIGAMLMVAGTLFILLPQSGGGVNTGDFIILGGGILPPLGNLAMQRARKEVSAAYIMFWRSLAGSLMLGIFAYGFDGLPTAASVWASLPVLLCLGFVVLGFSKILWIEAIHRLPITQSISLASIQPFLTMLFAYAILSQKPELVQFYSLPPIIVGMFLLTRKTRMPVEALQEV